MQTNFLKLYVFYTFHFIFARFYFSEIVTLRKKADTSVISYICAAVGFIIFGPGDERSHPHPWLERGDAACRAPDRAAAPRLQGEEWDMDAMVIRYVFCSDVKLEWIFF